MTAKTRSEADTDFAKTRAAYVEACAACALAHVAYDRASTDFDKARVTLDIARAAIAKAEYVSPPGGE